MSEPLVSVLLPAYNAEKYIAEAIDSVLNQTYSNFEFITINDGSTDRTEEIILSYADPRIRYVKNETNLELINTLNKGLELTNGVYIVRMDADDVCYPNRLEKQVAFMEQYPEVGIAGSWFEYLENGVLTKATPPVKDGDIRSLMVMATTLHHPTVIIRSTLLQHPQLDFRYDPKFKHVEDYHLWIRAALFTKFANVPNVLLKYRVHPESICAKNWTEQVVKFNEVRKISFPTLLNIPFRERFFHLINTEPMRKSDEEYKYIIRQWQIIQEAIKATGRNKALINKRFSAPMYRFFHNNYQMGWRNLYYFLKSGVYHYLPARVYATNYLKLVIRSILPFFWY